MPDTARRVVIDNVQRKLFVDGAEFPWCVSEVGPTVDCQYDQLMVVAVPILADEVEIIGPTARAPKRVRSFP